MRIFLELTVFMGGSLLDRKKNDSSSCLRWGRGQAVTVSGLVRVNFPETNYVSFKMSGIGEEAGGKYRDSWLEGNDDLHQPARAEM